MILWFLFKLLAENLTDREGLKLDALEDSYLLTPYTPNLFNVL